MKDRHFINKIQKKKILGRPAPQYLVLITLLFGWSTSVLSIYTDKVLVIVNEDVITQSELDYRLKIIEQDLQANNPQATKPEGLADQVLEGIIADRLQLQEAERRGIEVSDEELDNSINRYAQDQNQTISQLKQSMTKDRLSYSLFRSNVRDSLILSRLNDYYARVRVSVPDYEIDGFIAQNNLTQNDTEYQIAHILFSNPEENEQLANEVLDELRSGLDFAQAATQYSNANDAEEGGMIGWRKLNQLPEIFVSALKEMQPGDVSSVLTSPNGLHILKLVDQKGQLNEITQTKVQHILINAEGKVAVSQAKKRANELRQRLLNGENFSQVARIYSDDSVSAANGGDLGWVSPNEMVSNFEKAFDQLKLNELSEPVTTQFGVHLIKVLDRRQKNINDRLVRARAENILRRQRANREFSQWVRQLREQAYIEYVGKEDSQDNQ